MLAELGHSESGPPNAVEVNPPPSLDELRAAERVIHEPELRLIHELLWFLPLAAHADVPDAALGAIEKLDLKGAIGTWKLQAAQTDSAPIEGAVANHNLAVCWHMQALDREESQKDANGSDPKRDAVAACWRQAFKYWTLVHGSAPTWNALSARAITIDDNRISLDFVQSLRRTIPRAITKTACEAVLRHLEGERVAVATQLLDQVVSSDLHSLDPLAVFVYLWEPVKVRLRRAIVESEANLSPDKKNGHLMARRLLATATAYEAIFPTFGQVGALQDVESLCDEIADAIRQRVVDHYNATDDSLPAAELLAGALRFARSASSRQAVIDNDVIITNNTVFAATESLREKIRIVNESKTSAKERLNYFRQSIEPEITANELTLARSEEVKATVLDVVSRALRSIFVDAWNQSRDVATAVAALDLADAYASTDETRVVLRDDRASLASLSAEHQRAEAEKKKKKYGWIAAGVVILAVLFAIDSQKTPKTAPQGDRTRFESNQETSPGEPANDSNTVAGTRRTYRVPNSMFAELTADRARVDAAQREASNLSDQVQSTRAFVEEQQSEAEAATNEVSTLGSQIELERTSISAEDSVAVDAFNAKIHRYNRLLAEAKRRKTEADRYVDEYNASLTKAKQAAANADQMVDQFNAKLERYGH